MQRRSPEQFEQAGRAGGGGERTDSWEVAHLDRRDNPESHRARSGRRDGEGDRVRALRTGRGGSQVCERRGPRPSLPRIDVAAQSTEDSCCSPTSSFSSVSAHSLSSYLA